MKKILTVVGARPQFIKLSPVSKELRKYFKEVIVHTGQHYDEEMSTLFFKELTIPKPNYNLGIKETLQGVQTGKMMEALEQVIIKERPSAIIVYGDTNSTLAGALVASKLHIPLIHVEAGLRSYNKKMPEEINRIVADHLSTILFSPTETGVKNLKKEGIEQGVYNVGDVMYDALLQNIKVAEKSVNLERFEVTSKDYILATIHRAENTNNPQRLKEIFQALAVLKEKIVLPIHPRTKKYLKGISVGDNINIINPVGYLEMLVLEKNAKKIATDSGGVQKEAFFLKVPCVTLRDETEWVETLENGNNVLTGAQKSKIIEKLGCNNTFKEGTLPFGEGKASVKLVEIIKKKILA